MLFKNNTLVYSLSSLDSPKKRSTVSLKVDSNVSWRSFGHAFDKKVWTEIWVSEFADQSTVHDILVPYPFLRLREPSGISNNYVVVLEFSGVDVGVGDSAKKLQIKTGGGTYGDFAPAITYEETSSKPGLTWCQTPAFENGNYPELIFCCFYFPCSCRICAIINSIQVDPSVVCFPVFV